MKYSHNSNCKLVTTSASSTKAYNFQFCKQMLTQNCLNLDRYIFIAYELTPHALSSFKCSHTSLCEWTIVFVRPEADLQVLMLSVSQLVTPVQNRCPPSPDLCSATYFVLWQYSHPPLHSYNYEIDLCIPTWQNYILIFNVLTQLKCGGGRE